MPNKFHDTVFSESSMQVLDAQLYLSGTSMTVASGSKAFVSASRQQAGIYKLFLRESYNTNFAIVKTSYLASSPFTADAGVTNVLLVGKDLTRRGAPSITLAIKSGSIGTGTAITGSFVDPLSNFATLDLELTVKK